MKLGTCKFKLLTLVILCLLQACVPEDKVNKTLIKSSGEEEARVSEDVNYFNFENREDVSLGETIFSNTITLSGPSAEKDINIWGDGSPQFRIDGGPWRTSGKVKSGQKLQLRLTSGLEVDTEYLAVVEVGDFTQGWLVKTLVQDKTPNTFHFPSLTGSVEGTLNYLLSFCNELLMMRREEYC